jgi:hypothetical protein
MQLGGLLGRGAQNASESYTLINMRILMQKGMQSVMSTIDEHH